MRAENLLYVLDEFDELQVLLRESFRPGAFGVLVVLLNAASVSWLTSSPALGFSVLVVGAWVMLCVAWIGERRVHQLQRDPHC